MFCSSQPGAVCLALIKKKRACVLSCIMSGVQRERWGVRGLQEINFSKICILGIQVAAPGGAETCCGLWHRLPHKHSLGWKQSDAPERVTCTARVKKNKTKGKQKFESQFAIEFTRWKKTKTKKKTKQFHLHPCLPAHIISLSSGNKPFLEMSPAGFSFVSLHQPLTSPACSWELLLSSSLRSFSVTLCMHVRVYTRRTCTSPTSMHPPPPGSEDWLLSLSCQRALVVEKKKKTHCCVGRAWADGRTEGRKKGRKEGRRSFHLRLTTASPVWSEQRSKEEAAGSSSAPFLYPFCAAVTHY